MDMHFQFDTLKANSCDETGYLLSLKFIHIMPPFLVGDCRLKVSDKDYIYPSHKNLLRRD